VRATFSPHCFNKETVVDKKTIEYTVHAEVHDAQGKKIGSETMSFVFPVLEETEGPELEVAINNISETQEICAKIAVACSNSCTWKAARTLVSRRQPVGPDGMPLPDSEIEVVQ
jgi:hypothetical protein